MTIYHLYLVAFCLINLVFDQNIYYLIFFHFLGNNFFILTFGRGHINKIIKHPSLVLCDIMYICTNFPFY